MSPTAAPTPHQTVELLPGMVSLFNPDPVRVPDVEPALSGLWREHCQQEGGDEEALVRACMWNLVAFNPHPQHRRGDAAREAPALQRMLAEVSGQVPARILYLEQFAKADAPAPDREVEAWVATNCLTRGPRGRLLCAEEIHLAGYGEQGQSHFPALVRALLVPDLPVALFWPEGLPRVGRVLGQLMRLGDRLVIDSRSAPEANELATANELQRTFPTAVIDLGWLRLTPLRRLLAECFDLPEHIERLQRLESLRITATSQGRHAACLMLGWLLSRCGYESLRAVDMGGRAELWRWQAQQSGRRLQIDLVMSERVASPSGVGVMEITAGGAEFVLSEVEEDCMAVRTPERELPKVRLQRNRDTQLIVQSLGGKPRDAVYAAALDVGAKLADQQAWSQ